ncbi:MAG: mannitol dehydrogenase family protein, partial [Deinococcus sp.]
DVEPYELMKLRLLNASHQALSYLGLLAGHRYVHEVCQQPAFVEFLLGYMEAEATPTLRPVPGIDLGAYRHELIARFASSAVQDTLARLIVDGSERVPKFLLPVVRDQLASGGEIGRSALVVASWSHYVGEVGRGNGEALVDPRASLLTGAALREDGQPGAFLELREVFGDLGQDERFKSAYLSARESLRREGPLGAMRALLSQEGASSSIP